MEPWGFLFFLCSKQSAQVFLGANHSFGLFPYTKPESRSLSFVITKQEIVESATTTRQISDLRSQITLWTQPGRPASRTTLQGLDRLGSPRIIALHLLPWIIGKVPCPRMPSLLSVRFHDAWELSQALLISFQALRYTIPPWLDLSCWKPRLLIQSFSGLGLLRTTSTQKGHIQGSLKKLSLASRCVVLNLQVERRIVARIEKDTRLGEKIDRKKK